MENQKKTELISFRTTAEIRDKILLLAHEEDRALSNFLHHFFENYKTTEE